MAGLFFKAVPVLADEDKIGGSAIKHPSTRRIGTLAPRRPQPPPSDEASSVLSGKKYMREERRGATPWAPLCMDDEWVGGEAGSIGQGRRDM